MSRKSSTLTKTKAVPRKKCVASKRHNECKYCGINMDARDPSYSCPNAPNKK